MLFKLFDDCFESIIKIIQLFNSFAYLDFLTLKRTLL